MLEGAQGGGIQLVQRSGFKLELNFHNLLNLHQKPGVNLGQGKHFVHAHTHGKSVTHIPNTVRAWRAELALQHLTVLGFFVHAVHAHFQTPQGFLKRFLEGAAHRHDLTHRLHLCCQAGIRCGKFLESKTRNLGNHVINAGLKTGRCRATGDFVAQLIQRVTHRQFGSHLGNRKTSGFGSQRRRARHARIHLDHHHAAIDRVDGKLHVGTTGVHTDFTQHRQRRVAQDLVFLVAQRLRRRHRDRIARVDTHGVQIFN